ncbi:MAG: ABC transporter ATP-binding protein [Halanaerobiales bacterium]|nr:ABC transporter ATP-binding protein [Halanaerobiales bacterium]
MKKYFFKRKGLILIVVLMIFISSILNVGLVFITKSIIDLLTIKDISMNKFFMTVAGAFLFLLVMVVVNYISCLSKAKFIRSLMLSLKADIYNKICDLSITKFNDKNSALYISILINDINVLEKSYFNSVLSIISNILVFIISVIALVNLNIYLAVVAIATGIIPLFIPKLTHKRLSSLREEYSTNAGRFIARVKDIFTGFEVIKSFNIHKQIFDEYSKENSNMEHTKFKTTVFEGIIEALSMLSGFSMFCITLAFGVYLTLKNIITIGTVIAATQLTNNVINPIVRIGLSINAVKSSRPIIEKIEALSVQETEVSKNILKEDFDEKIIFSDVCFSYDNKVNVLDDLNFEIEKEKKYAIVGHSGSGKSTILRLLLDYYNNYSGEILMDGIKISDIQLESLYKLVSIIHQNVFIFDTTIKENITLYQQYAEDKIKEVIQLSGLSQLISSFENEENTFIGEAGNRLSGGEKQRIAIARALIRNTPILLLDEATASLDNTMAYNIENSILNLKDITALVITHKLSQELLTQYYSILVMKNGRLVEKGSFEHLMEHKEYFCSLYLAQEEKNTENELAKVQLDTFIA